MGLHEQHLTTIEEDQAPVTSLVNDVRDDEEISRVVLGSSSRLAGLGRASRSQLAALLDEFWGLLYDLHGQPISERGSYRPYTQMLDAYVRGCRERGSYRPYTKMLDAYVRGCRERGSLNSPQTCNPVDAAEATILESFRCCILQLLRLEGSDWLFRQNDGVDEDLIDRVAAMEKCLYEVETTKMSCGIESGDPLYLDTESKSGTIPLCGEGCVWKMDLIVSFGVWCIRRILDLSLMESRPELWGKYTYVLNRLQGIVDPAFSEPRTPMSPCLCLQLSAAHQQQKSSPPSNSMLPPASEPGRGKCTDASTLLDLIEDVKVAISGRKGRSGTAAGDAYRKGKENLVSVLKRYKRRLGNKDSK